MSRIALPRRALPALSLVALLLMAPAPADAINRTWNYLTTGNGHGFQVFDRGEHRITDFLEHPYRYVAPGDAGRTWGVGRRDLAHDLYFGVRAGGQSVWLHDQTDVEYQAETNIIHAWSTQGGVRTDTYYWAPFGFEANGMIMLVKATNTGGGDLPVSLYAKVNFKLGQGRVDPGEESEEIAWQSQGGLDFFTETGPGGGHALYVPIGGFDHAGCGGDTPLYNAVLSSGSAGDTRTCNGNGNGQVAVLQKDVTLGAGQSAWWGAALLFVNDNPNDPAAALFKDERSVGDLVTAWKAFVGDKSAEQVHAAALAEWEAWRSHREAPGLSAVEKKLWRQSEAVLRMGQVREPLQANRKNHGMVLAALPVGEWHTGWLRDGVYAIVALAKLGYIEEAQKGVEMYLGADNSFFAGANYLKHPYRVTTCRYFGNGMEEADFNNDGPNVETDGWGLVLWAARMVLHCSCDGTWLDKPTWRGDTVFEALTEIAGDIEEHIQGDLPEADASIWEVHWNRRQVFTYTAACQARGLHDFADIARWKARTDLESRFRGLANKMVSAMKSALVYQAQKSLASHLGVSGNPVHVDGSTVEAFSWDLIPPNDPITTGTMNGYSKLITGFGGYKRIEQALSLTGQSGASEYDLSEWILLDLRISDVWRRRGDTAQADGLLNKITEHATANDFLIPELYDPNNGRYTGVVPMNGYGAGAWIMTQMAKHGFRDPTVAAGFGHCVVEPPADDPVVTEDGEVIDPPETTGDTTKPDTNPWYPTDTGSGNDAPYYPGTDTTGGGADAQGPNWDDGSASFCAFGGIGARGAGLAPWLLSAALGLLLARRRREQAELTGAIPRASTACVIPGYQEKPCEPERRTPFRHSRESGNPPWALKVARAVGFSSLEGVCIWPPTARTAGLLRRRRLGRASSTYRGVRLLAPSVAAGGSRRPSARSRRHPPAPYVRPGRPAAPYADTLLQARTSARGNLTRGLAALFALVASTSFAAPAGAASSAPAPGSHAGSIGTAQVDVDEIAAADEAPDWQVDFHGYARMPLRWEGSPLSPRPPYLVDDNYYLSGFSYLRLAETDWAEMFLGVRHGNTRFVAGFFASQFSDWSENTLSGQWGVATAAIEHTWQPLSWLAVDVKAGMFWERMGYLEPYDTYLFGRTHQAGALLGVRVDRDEWRAHLRGGYGAHADLINANQGFTPLAYLNVGGGWRFVDLSLYLLKAWTRDSEREFAIIEDGDLRVMGAELKVAVPYAGPLTFGVAHYKADKVLFLANAFELLHSTGGRGLTENFFGADSENGTGEIRVLALDVDLRAATVLRDLGAAGRPYRRWLDGLSLRLFGITATVLSRQQSENPAENRHDRTYLKWGVMPRYALPHPLRFLWVALRYDRVITDTDHESLSFRATSPMIGVTPLKGLDVFFAYSHYGYGENVRLRPNQIPGDRSVTTPDEDVFKIQAQIAW